jgi:transposase
MLAANMFDQHLPAVQIAAILEVDDQSVRRWQRIYRTQGREGLKGSKPPGAKAKLTIEQKQRIVQLLEKPPRHYGLEGWLWTGKLVASLIQQHFAVRYHHDHVSCLLRELGLSWQRPMHRAKERDEQAINAWRTQTWPALLKKAANPEESSSSPMKSAS